MSNLEPPDVHFLSAAMGWVGLGNHDEARKELLAISEANQAHPDVLEAHWSMLAHEEHWEKALQIAQRLVVDAPERSSGWIQQAYALRRVPNGGVKRAWEALLPAFDRFPREPLICFNLSCYACQMKQLDAAWVWFKRATVIGDKNAIKKQGLEEPDLEALWQEIARV